MIPVEPDLVFCDQSDEGAALGLLGLMTGLSEEHWCSGWMSGLEFSLWEAKAGDRFGQGVITERQATLLRLLSEECDGWWYWVRDSGPRFARLSEWREMVAKGKTS